MTVAEPPKKCTKPGLNTKRLTKLAQPSLGQSSAPSVVSTIKNSILDQASAGGDAVKAATGALLSSILPPSSTLP